MASERFRTKFCRNFALGHCPQGDRCKYVHSINIPTFSPYSAGFAMPGVNPSFTGQFSSPFSTAPANTQWPVTSLPLHGANMANYNWNCGPYSAPTANPSMTSQPPQFRPLSWRTTLCRHFVKNQGWCPLGDDCGYIHDLALAAHAANDIRFPANNRATSGAGSASNHSSRGRAGSKHSHCWAYVQGLCRVRDCPYLHPVAMHLFVPYTPCLAWPNCTRGMLCAYKHPESLLPRVSSVAPTFNTFSSPYQMQPPSPIQLFPGVQFHGTTYFSQAPAPSTGSSPQFPWSYPSLVHSVPSVHSPYSRDSIPYHSPYYETVPNLPPTSAVPRAFMPHPMDDVHRISGIPAVSDERVSGNGASETGRATNDDFPYCPPTGQRAGHARRVSVTLKSKEDTDALGLRTPTQQGTIRRQSWMGHRQREDPAHRSWPWSPDGVGTLSQSQSLQLMY